MPLGKKPANAVVIAMALLSGQVAAGDPAPPLAANASSALDGLVEQHMKAAGMMGVRAALIVDKKLVWAKGYGWADKGHTRAFPLPHHRVQRGQQEQP